MSSIPVGMAEITAEQVTERGAKLKIHYFAWVRERVGCESEDLELPETIVTVGDLIEWLRTMDDQHGMAFKEPDAIRTAIDQEHVENDAPIAGATEIAFFPPMTGG